MDTQDDTLGDSHLTILSVSCKIVVNFLILYNEEEHFEKIFLRRVVATIRLQPK